MEILNDRFMVTGKRIDNGAVVQGYLNVDYDRYFIYVIDESGLLEFDCLYTGRFLCREVDPDTVEPVAVRPIGTHKDTCPNCQKQNIKMQFYSVKTKNNYCPDCGQHIDWSEK